MTLWPFPFKRNTHISQGSKCWSSPLKHLTFSSLDPLKYCDRAPFQKVWNIKATWEYISAKNLGKVNTCCDKKTIGRGGKDYTCEQLLADENRCGICQCKGNSEIKTHCCGTCEKRRSGKSYCCHIKGTSHISVWTLF